MVRINVSGKGWGCSYRCMVRVGWFIYVRRYMRVRREFEEHLVVMGGDSSYH